MLPALRPQVAVVAEPRAIPGVVVDGRRALVPAAQLALREHRTRLGGWRERGCRLREPLAAVLIHERDDLAATGRRDERGELRAADAEDGLAEPGAGHAASLRGPYASRVISTLTNSVEPNGPAYTPRSGGTSL